MIRIIAILCGVAFIFVGVGGFLATFKSNGLLFSLFQVDTVHNVVHILTGVIAIMAATTHRSAKRFFQIFGFLYLIAALIGFWRGDLLIMPVNTADNVLHIAFAVLFLFLGFKHEQES